MGKLTQVREIEKTEDGFSVYSRLDSIFAWRKALQKAGKPFEEGARANHNRRLEAGICPICKDMKEIKDPAMGPMWCICYLWDYLLRIRSDWKDVSLPTKLPVETLDSIHLVGPSGNKGAIKNAVMAFKEFVNYPEKSLTVTGSVGIGKTHMLKGVVNALPYIAYYIALSDFQNILFRTMESNALDAFISVLQRAPILCLDDYGTEYSSDFSGDKFRGVIDWRYQRRKELKTLVVSNLTTDQIRAGDKRVGSRLLDTEATEIVEMGKLFDFRSMDPIVKAKLGGNK